jgi:peptide/nickel transport system permease protein
VRTYMTVRLASTIPVLFLITLIVFAITYLIPGDPATVMLGPDASPDQIAAVREEMGLNSPLTVRYARWVSRVAQGDLGTSYFSQTPVSVLVRRAMPASVQLMLFGTLIALAISIPAALISATRKNSAFDMLATVGAFAGISTPSFWLGIVLVWLFAVRWRMLPASGYVPPSEDLVRNLRGMILPSITLGLIMAAELMRYLRAGLLKTLADDYILTARMKGVREWLILLRHAFKNALIPFVTVLGLALAQLLGGTIVIEEVFAIPGMGRLGLNAILNRDYMVVQAVVLVMAAAFLLVNLVVDILYSVLDPRIRLGSRGGVK